MRSLTLKLTLAFLFVGIVGVALIAIVVRQQTQRQFDQFVLDRYQLDLLDDLSSYYRQNQSWQDFNAIVHQMSQWRIFSWDGIEHRPGPRYPDRCRRSSSLRRSTLRVRAADRAR